MDLCECGHDKSEHHISWFPGGGELVEECEFYGWNEHGGAELVDGKWVDHCQRYRVNKSESELKEK